MIYVTSVTVSPVSLTLHTGEWYYRIRATSSRQRDLHYAQMDLVRSLHRVRCRKQRLPPCQQARHRHHYRHGT